MTSDQDQFQTGLLTYLKVDVKLKLISVELHTGLSGFLIQTLRVGQGEAIKIL